ncbi:MAG: hypothetical protein AAB035_00945 [Nitrospirota bacterium]
MNESDEYYEQIESLLWQAADTVQECLSEEEYQLAIEFLEQGEYGLASDELHAVVMDKNMEYPEALKSARTIMGIG